MFRSGRLVHNTAYGQVVRTPEWDWGLGRTVGCYLPSRDLPHDPINLYPEVQSTVVRRCDQTHGFMKFRQVQCHSDVQYWPHGLQGEVRHRETVRAKVYRFTVINFRVISRVSFTCDGGGERFDHCHEGSTRLLSSRGL